MVPYADWKGIVASNSKTKMENQTLVDQYNHQIRIPVKSYKIGLEEKYFHLLHPAFLNMMLRKYSGKSFNRSKINLDIIIKFWIINII